MVVGTHGQGCLCVLRAGRAQGKGKSRSSRSAGNLKVDARKVELGEKLFLDRRVSRTIPSLASSAIAMNGAVPTALRYQWVSVASARADQCATIFNLAFNFRLSWDGRDASLESQVRAGITGGDGHNVG